MRAAKALALVPFAIAMAASTAASGDPSETRASNRLAPGTWQEPDDRLITADAMGPVRLEMTLDEARKALPAALFERTSDGDGAALVSVAFGHADRLVLWADEDDPDRPIDWSRRIVTITAFSKAFHTREGIHPEALVTDVIPIFGPVQEIVVSEIESREFVTFERQPAWLTFRLDYTGRFPAGARWTKDFQPGARILGITISSLARANAPSDADRAELGRLERVWNAAHERGDAEALDALWAPELIVTVPRMPAMGKADSLAIWRSGRLRFTRYATWALDFQVRGDTAIVEGRVERERVVDGTPSVDHWSFTKTYARQSGSWRVVAWRATEPRVRAADATPKASQPPPATLGAAWTALLGDWKGEGGGAPGSGSGGESFRFDLDKHVIVRRGISDYPATDGRPATHHEELTVIYPAASGDAASAVYFDNEGHVINYSATWSADGKTLVFLSTGDAIGPRYRLTYTMLGAGQLQVSFEVAPPGGGAFKTYVRGVNRRVSTP